MYIFADLMYIFPVLLRNYWHTSLYKFNYALLWLDLNILWNNYQNWFSSSLSSHIYTIKWKEKTSLVVRTLGSTFQQLSHVSYHIEVLTIILPLYIASLVLSYLWNDLCLLPIPPLTSHHASGKWKSVLFFYELGVFVLFRFRFCI